MLLYGALLRCLDPVLTIAAAQGWGRPVFWSPPDKRGEASRWLRQGPPALALRLSACRESIKHPYKA
jgi:hypothetical protein